MLNNKVYVIIAFLMIICFNSFSQNNRIGLSAAYNMPGGEMKWIYKNSPGIQINYSRLNSDKRERFLSYGVLLGYCKFKPVADTLYYLVDIGFDDIGYGTAVYHPNTMVQLMLTFGGGLPIIRNVLGIQFGLDAGYYYTFFRYSVSDELVSTDGTEIEGKGALAPGIGFPIKLSKKIQMVPYFKYNFYFSLGSSEVGSTYNPNVGSFNFFYTSGVSINYTF